MGISLEKIDKRHFFGDFELNTAFFQYNQNDRSIIHEAADELKRMDVVQSPLIEKAIISKAKTIKHWFSDNTEKHENRPLMSQNLLNVMSHASHENSNRPKQGYRYNNDFKRFCVHNRLLSGQKAFKTLQSNLIGCFPSISTTNRYIHRADHAIVEGDLRVDELLVYLTTRNQPLWVALSEDATRIENRLQYDSRTNQIIGFCLPMDHNGMPIPFSNKARTATEILSHFSNDTPVANFVNTIIAKPLGGAESFCLLIYGTTGQGTAEDVSKRWEYVTEQLKKVGINVLSISSDSDPKNNAAMRKNSSLGKTTFEKKSFQLFKCGTNFDPPFYIQDYVHIATKLRNLILKTIEDDQKLPFGDYFIRQEHLQQLLNYYGKDEVLLTATTLNPTDRQNFESARKICSEKVIKLLRNKVKDSQGTAMFLQIMSDLIETFHDPNMLPLERLKKFYHATFLVRIWRNFILNQPGLTLKNNFMSSFCYYCIELNAHALVFTLLYLQKNNLTHLFIPHMLSSQPCELFFRQIRSFTSTNSTVVNFSTKEVLDRVSRTQLLSEISNDSQFVFPKSLKSSKSTCLNPYEFPDEKLIISTIEKCQVSAIEEAKKYGLIKKQKLEEICNCRVPPYVSNRKIRHNENDDTIYFEDGFEKLDELQTRLASTSLKNYADKFEENSLPETSSYVEFALEHRRFVFKKTSLCWLLRKESYKCSSDRKYRVRGSKISKRKKNLKSSKAL